MKLWKGEKHRKFCEVIAHGLGRYLQLPGNCAQKAASSAAVE
jgi:hypothetical protein